MENKSPQLTIYEKDHYPTTSGDKFRDDDFNLLDEISGHRLFPILSNPRGISHGGIRPNPLQSYDGVKAICTLASKGGRNIN